MSRRQVRLLNSTLEKKNPKQMKKDKTKIELPQIKNNPEDDAEEEEDIDDKIEHYVLEMNKDEELKFIKTKNDPLKNAGSNDDEPEEDEENDEDDDADDDDEMKTDIKVSEFHVEDDAKSVVQEVLEHVCGKCFKSFPSYQHYAAHSMYCKNDGEIARNIENMLKNLRTIEKESIELDKQDICICCKESWETAHKSGHIRCPKCPKSFKNNPSFERHLCLIHSDNIDYECMTCNAKCPSANILKLHQKAHLRGKPFACRKCGEEFTRKYHLNRHHLYSNCEISNITKKVALCKVCGKEFYRLDNLRMHLKQHLGQDTKTKDYPCPYCGKAFYGTATLNIHIRTHTGERPFICDLCGNSFPSNPALRKHHRTHTGERPYQCSKCFRSFAAKEVLNRHMKTHTGEKPHGCDLCGKRFIQATQLKQHLLTHKRKAAGRKIFSCRKCKLLFETRKELTDHTAEKHRNEKQEKSNIECQHCEKILRTEGGLKRHITRVHVQKALEGDGGDSQFLCEMCDEVFENKKNLDFHILKVHDNNAEKEIEISDILIEEEDDTKYNEEEYEEVILQQDCDMNLTESEDNNSKWNCKFCHKNFNNNKKLITHMENDHGAVVLSVGEQNNSQNNIDETTIETDEIEISVKEEETNVEMVEIGEYYIDGENRIIKAVTDNNVENNKEKNKIIIDNNKNKRKIKNETIDTKGNGDNDDDDDDDDYVVIKLKKKPKNDRKSSSPVISMDEKSLTENVKKLLDLLIDKDILKKFGYPKKPVEEVLLKVIKNCGHKIKNNNDSTNDYMTRLRDYVKLLFTVVVDNDSIKELLNNHPIDKVIYQVLEMAGRNT